MKIGVMVIVLNGGDYLWFSLMNTKRCLAGMDYAISIVHGADQFTPIQHNGFSVDGTFDIIRKFVQLHGKECSVRYRNIGQVMDKRDLRNASLDSLKDCDIIIIKDHDEFWDRDNILASIKQFEESDKQVMLAQHIMFVGTFGYIANRNDSGLINRAFKNGHEVRFKTWHTLPDGMYDRECKILTDANIYHAGYVLPMLRLQEKRIHRIRQDNWYYENVTHTDTRLDIADAYRGYAYTGLVEPFALTESHKELYEHPYHWLSSRGILDYPCAYPTFIEESLQ